MKPLPKILVIDDTPDHIWLIDAMLGAEYEVLAACSGSEAMRLAHTTQPDAILLDLILENETGLDICRQLKADPTLADIPVLFMSIRDEAEVEHDCFIAGGVDFLRKPFFAQVVRTRLATHVGYRQAIQALRDQMRHDPVTGLINRTSFDEILVREWESANRNRASLGMLLVSVDYFKALVDLGGEATGDDCLRRIAGCVRHAARRANDLAAHFAADEFALLLPNTDNESIMAIGNRVCEQVRKLAIPHPMGGTISVSIGGAARIPDPDDLPQQLLDHCLAALHRARLQGRDCIRD